MYFDNLIQRFPALLTCLPQIRRAYDLLRERLSAGGTLFVCGNGGSAADAEHIVGELMKGFLKPRRLEATDVARLQACSQSEWSDYLARNLQGGIRAVSLTGHVSLSTAVQNDTAGDMVFAQQLFALGRAGDVFLGISCSGHARNVILAAVVARSLGMSTIGLSGRSGGRLTDVSDTCICVPSDETPIIQEYHVPVYHALCAMLEAFFFPDEK